MLIWLLSSAGSWLVERVSNSHAAHPALDIPLLMGLAHAQIIAPNNG